MLAKEKKLQVHLVKQRPRFVDMKGIAHGETRFHMAFSEIVRLSSAMIQTIIPDKRRRVDQEFIACYEKTETSVAFLFVSYDRNATYRQFTRYYVVFFQSQFNRISH